MVDAHVSGIYLSEPIGIRYKDATPSKVKGLYVNRNIIYYFV